MHNNDDRSWMYDRGNVDQGYINPYFVDGVNRFLDFAFSQGHLAHHRRVKCPCSRCGLSKSKKRNVIQEHLLKYGFVPHYYVWEAHGEMSNFSGNYAYAGESSTNNDNVENGYVDMVNDTYGGQFEGRHYNENIEEEPNREARDFFEMLREAEVPIHIDVVTTPLEWLTTFIADKVRHGTTNASADNQLQAAHRLISPAERHRLPGSWYGVKTFIKSLGLGYVTYDVCVNICILYYGEYESENWTECPYCGEARYEENINKKKLVPRKKLWYLPVTPRLQRLYTSRKISEHMTWHLKCHADTDQMIHPASSLAWKTFDRIFPDFAVEPRNVRLGLCTDGFNPFGNSSAPYSCWPVFVTPYNLPPDLCMRQEYIFLSLMISGPKSPGKNIDVLLRPLIDELKSLWDFGVQTYDSFRKQNFQMRASLIWTISDYPGYGMLSQWSTSGRLSCPYCMEATKSFQLKHGRKTSFFDCHRRFLPLDHPWRLNSTDFTKGRIETDQPLPRRSGIDMLRHVERLPPVGFGICGEFVEGFGLDHNWCRRSIFWELPYWKHNLIRHNLDVMHCEKNFFDNIKNTVMDDPEKTKDNMNSRKDLQLLTGRRSLFLQTGQGGRVYKRKASYCLSKDEKVKVCEWLCNLKFPDGYASNISRCVQMPQLRLVGMKSHDCHVFLQRLVPIAFRDFLPDSVWGPLVEISNFFRALSAPDIRYSDMELLERSIVVTMCKLEKIFPPSFFDSMEHLAIHLPWEAKVGGPVQYRWMYPFERRMFDFKRTRGNKAHIEGSIVEAYIYSEIANFSSLYFDSSIETRATRLNRNEVPISIDPSDQLSVFQRKGKSMGRCVNYRNLTLTEHKAAHLYVLLNCPEVECWLSMFDEQMCAGYPQGHKDQIRNTYFVDWFKQVVVSGSYSVDPRLRGLAQGPVLKAETYNGYKVNGFKFHTETYGAGRQTMNSGVYVKGDTGDPDARNFYGMLQEIIQLDYWGSGNLEQIVIFKCDWYDVYNGITTHPTYGLVDINPTMRLGTEASEPFILASQAQQVYYSPYPSQKNTSRRGWWAVCTTRARYLVDTTALANLDIYQDSTAPLLRLDDINNIDNTPIRLADDDIVEVDDDNTSADDDVDEDPEDGDDDDPEYM